MTDLGTERLKPQRAAAPRPAFGIVEPNRFSTTGIPLPQRWSGLCWAASFLLLLLASPTWADIILVPDLTYLEDTNKIPISGPSPTSALTDGMQTVRFSNPLAITPFLPWGIPPDVEAADPGKVLFQPTAAPVTLTLSSPVRTFGFELANDAYAALQVTATFRLGTSVVEIDQRMLASGGSALLFAVTEPTFFDNVVISAPDASIGYAVAQVRYSPDALISFIPEPASLTLLGLGMCGLFGYAWRRQKPA
jgi:hypothetical protein